MYNRPGNYSNVDVRKDCVIDYTRENVTLKNFESVLFGNKTAVEGIESGRVLESGEYDNVFIYYVDHGAYLSVALPDGSLLYADQLLSYLKTMKSLKKFYRLVIYVESCHSGSMFDGILPDDLGVYAVSASNPY